MRRLARLWRVVTRRRSGIRDMGQPRAVRAPTSPDDCVSLRPWRDFRTRTQVEMGPPGTEWPDDDKALMDAHDIVHEQTTSQYGSHIEDMT